MSASAPAKAAVSNFIRAIIDEDLKSGKRTSVVTRFPPEPNGYLHVGHAKSICLNFGLARDYAGQCNLRMDDTNPTTEDVEYVESIMGDVRWLGFDWGEGMYFASDYFDTLYHYAEKLIQKGMAYVCSLSADETRAYRGTLTEPGRNSPFRERSIEESLLLFREMRDGKHADGTHILRAKIDMASPNINMRDPALYRIRHAPHHRTGTKWCIYPMYDYAHCVSDAIEGITHSICTLEFEDHRPLYDWCLDELQTPHHPQQIEFARLNLNYTITSKRKLRQLVEEKHVASWDDPRMPTIVGMRRRGYTPVAIRNFCDRIGVARADSVVDVGMLEHAVREDLDATAERAMAVLRPLKVTLIDWPEGKVETLSAPRHPHQEAMGQRELPFGRELFIESDDFMDNPPKDYFRLSPGAMARLRNAYVIKCEEVIRDAQGRAIELRCTHLPETLGGKPLASGVKVKGIIHWVSAEHAIRCEVRLYDRLFTTGVPGEGEPDGDFRPHLNPESLVTLEQCAVEPSLAKAQPEARYQFERLGYFVADRHDCKDGRLVFNRTVSLKDSWAKIAGKN